MADYTHQTRSTVPVDVPLFQPVPAQVNFHSHAPFQTYEQTLLLRNSDSFARRVKVLAPANAAHFKIRAQQRASTTGKVAAGMEIAYTIEFTPDGVGDFACDLVVVTEREKFVVPVRVAGARPALDLPDLVSFGTAVSKQRMEKSLLLRNVGTDVARFDLAASAPFEVTPRYGELAVGETLQATLHFVPPAAGRYAGELVVAFDSGQHVAAELAGTAVDAQVSLSDSSLTLLPTFIHKASQRTFKLVNNSDDKVAFSFRQFLSGDEEQAARLALLEELDADEDADAAELEASGAPRIDDEAAEDEEEDERRVLDNPWSKLEQRFREQRVEVEHDRLLFESEGFSVSPLEGEVWPRSTAEVTVTFHPRGPHMYENVAFCEVQGVSARLPLTVRAQGVGPKAMFSYDVLDVGDTFINSVHQYEIELQNRGEIEAEFALVPPSTEFGTKFSFEPSSGVLDVGEVQTIQVTFASDRLGEFSENFLWAITGSSEMLTLDFKGRVIGPTFVLDEHELLFGTVSYGFSYSKSLFVRNTSEIPMRFNLRCPADAGGEVSISPSSGTILPQGRQRVTVELEARTVQRYDGYEMLLDVPGVGEGLVRVPVDADCQVPRIAIHTEQLDYGTCFLRHPYTLRLCLTNESKLPAKFEVLPQDEQSKGLAVYTASVTQGTIPALGEQWVDVTLVTERQGGIQLPMYVRIVGSSGKPLEVTIAAHSRGPILDFALTPLAAPLTEEQMRADHDGELTCSAVDFGRVEVLKEHSRVLHVTNHSLIPAEFKTFISGKDSAYSVDLREGNLAPGESAPITVTMSLDDTIKAKDTLNVLVVEGNDSAIALSATGTGSTVTCADIDGSEGGVVDFGTQFTNRPFSKEVVLVNNGRRAQTLQWLNTKAMEQKAAAASSSSKKKDKGAKGGSKKDKEAAKERAPPEEIIFSVQPERASIKPKQSAVFTFSGVGTMPTAVAEAIECTSTIGKATKTVYSLEFRADVATPLLEYSSERLDFVYSYSKSEPVRPLMKPLTLRNRSKLPLAFALRAQAPFSVDRPDWVLEPGEAATVNVCFDAGGSRGRESTVHNSTIAVVYSDNPQREAIAVSGEINFPNLGLSKAQIGFGCVLNDTTRREEVTITNTSRVPAAYTWAFHEDEGAAAASKGGAEQLAPSAFFDILPIRSVLQPGESELVEFAYYAHANSRCAASAVCRVEGGPDYEVALNAESSSVKFSLDRSTIDCGKTTFNKTVTKELVLSNNGRVAFDWAINLRTLSRSGVVDVSPGMGHLEAAEKARLTVRITPGIPDTIEERFFVEVAHFSPHGVLVQAEGIYPSIALSLARESSEDFSGHLLEAHRLLEASGPRHPVPASMRERERPPKTAKSTRSAPSPVGGESAASGEAEQQQQPQQQQQQQQQDGGADGGTLAESESVGGVNLDAAAASYTPSQYEVEAEADRLVMRQFLLAQEAERQARHATNPRTGRRSPVGAEASADTVGSVPSRTSGHRLAAPTARKLRHAPSQRVVLSRYTLDFGNVIKGTHKRRTFRLTNTGLYPATLNIEKHVLASYGFALEPETVIRLPGAPDHESVDMSVTLQTTGAGLPTGQIECVLPIEIRGGPTVLVTLRANITVPDLEVSTDAIDFGLVQVGRCKVATVQLHNPKGVPCEWHLKRPMDSAKDWEFFTCEPGRGTLQPGERRNVTITFEPVAGKEAYLQRVPFKINHNPKMVAVQCRGRGFCLGMRFEPPSLDMGAILPDAEPAEQELRLCNDLDVPIEVFCLDTDKQFKQEEEMLREAGGYTRGGKLLLPVREPGEPIWESVASAYAAKQREAEAKEAAAKAAEEATEKAADGDADGEEKGEGEGDAGDGVNGAAAEAVADDAAADADAEAATTEGVGELENPATAPPPPADESVNAIVLGADAAVAGEVAASLARKYGAALLTADGCVAACRAAAAAQAANAVETLTVEQGSAGGGSADGAAVGSAAGSAGPSPQPPLAAVPALPVEGAVPREALLAAVAWRLADDDCAGGAVFAGLGAESLEAETLEADSDAAGGDAGAEAAARRASTVASVLLEALGLTREATAGTDAAGSENGGEGGGDEVWRGRKSVKVIALRTVAGEAAADEAGKSPHDGEATAQEGGAEGDSAEAADGGAEGEGAAASEGGSVTGGGEGGGSEAPDGAVAKLAAVAAFEASLRAVETLVGSGGVCADGGGGDAGGSSPVTVGAVDISGLGLDELMERCCEGLPLTEEDLRRQAVRIPPAAVRQVVRRPEARAARAPVMHFALLSAASGSAGEGEGGSEVADGASDDGGADTVQQQGGAQTRWVIPARGSIALRVRFTSSEIGTHDEMLGFEVCGGGGETASALPLRGVCAHPSVSSDYRNVYYRKTKTRPASPDVRRQFVVNRGVFDFGALLAGKAKGEVLEGKFPDNMEKFRITNNGLFDLKVDFSLRGPKKPTSEEAGEDGKTAEAAEPEPAGEPVFGFDPPSMELKVDETQDLTVYAFPPAVGFVEDAILATVEHNPVPVEYRLQCTGSSPLVELGRSELAFERLLVGRKETLALEVKNVCLLPVKWRLTGTEGLADALSVSATEGTVDARCAEAVLVTFDAADKAEHAHELKLEVQDVDGLLETAQEVAIPVSAEAYSIDVDVAYPDEEKGGLDYGVVKVNQEDVTQTLKLANKGKYKVEYKFAAKTQLSRELFTIEPAEGEIEPEAEVEVVVHFNKLQTLKREVTLSKNADIQLSITEPLTGKRESNIPVRVDVRAIFSKYSIMPARGINFGPLVYNTTSEPRTFEVTNNGEFPLTVSLGPYGGEDDIVTKTPRGDAGGESKAPPPQSAASDALELGNFTLSPATAVVAPGEAQSFSVTFRAEKARTFAELVGIEISDRDPSDHPGGIPYELAGESCIPGINAEDVATIFEEHAVVPSLDPLTAAGERAGSYFAMRERAFDFGAVIAQMDVQGGDKGGADGDATAARGVSANLRVSNPNKVPCVVNFALKPKPGQPAEDFPMEVQPSKCDLPPHEHRYVTVYFHPRAIASYAAVFEANVDNGEGDPRTQSFSCEVRGEGTLPHVLLEQPSTLTDEGAPLLAFPRLLLGKTHAMPVTLLNNGIVPATVSMRLDAPGGAFSLLDGGEPSTLQLAPKESHTLQVAFSPEGEPAACQGALTVAVMRNRFETHAVQLRGEGYMSEVAFDGLPQGLDDELRLEDGPVGAPSQVAFTVGNHTAKHFRFDWAELEGFSFEPAFGHLHAHATKDVIVTFAPAEAVTHEGLEAALNLKRIELPAEAAAAGPTPWDSRMTSVRFVEGEDGRSEKVVEVEAEPEHTVSEGEPDKSVILRVFATADNSRYECSTSEIAFRTTMMFQARVHSFTLRNESRAAMPFAWRVARADTGEVERAGEGAYTVSPASGTVLAGREQSVSVRFAPREVEDFSRVLHCDIPHLDGGYTPLAISLSGAATRPWCHFELPESDYVSAGRRNPERAGPGGRVGPLDAATRTLEFESLGTKVRNTRRFLVLNPTSIAYEYSWEPAEVAGGGSNAAALPQRSVFRCVNRRGMIGPGKSAEMVFEYTPEAQELQEDFWRFRIPEQGIEVPFLLVGTVTEPRVALDRTSLNFNRVLCGAKQHEVVQVVNDEKIPFSFHFQKAAFDSGEGRPVLSFTPSSGVVPPNSSLAVTVEFSPLQEREVNLNAVLVVKRKPTRLSLNIKGSGYAVHDSLQLELQQGRSVELAPSSLNTIDMGQVLVNQRIVRRLAVCNQGDLSLDFAWKCGDNHAVSVEPLVGTVGKGGKAICELSYHPSSAEKLDNYRVRCEVVNGKAYTLGLAAVAHRPKLQLSATTVDFGPRFLHQPSTEPAMAVITAVNKDADEISYDVLYDNTSHMEVTAPPAVLAPGDSREIVIRFMPREEVAYKEVIPIEINGLMTVNVTVKGEGTPLRVELADASQKQVNFGSIRLGSEAVREVRLVNRSRIAAPLSLAPSLALLERYGVRTEPSGEVTLKPREALPLRLYFKPQSRTRPFAEEVVASVAGFAKPLFAIAGAALGTEVKLAGDSVPFGAVVLGSRKSWRLQLENTGDVGTRFTWDTEALGANFSITPAEGFVAPGQDVMLLVEFHPVEVSRDVRVERVRCSLEGAEPQHLTLTGRCEPQDAEGVETLAFETRVRGELTKSVSIANGTNAHWSLRPSIANAIFSGPELLNVPAGKSVEYPITYRPVAMSKEGETHEGSIFFPVPDGSALMYKLSGTAGEPELSGSVQERVPAKVPKTVAVKVANWLNEAQRFVVAVELETEATPGTTLKAPATVDVPALATRDCKLQFMAYKEGVTKARVRFTNEASGEWLFYDVSVEATAPDLQGSLALECPARQLVKASPPIVVKNPLAYDVTLACEADHTQLSLPAQLTVPGGGSAEVPLAFRPLLVGEAAAQVTLTSDDLGVYKYAVALSGTPAGAERGLMFSVPLGQRETRSVFLTHYVADKCEFATRIEGSGDFDTDAAVTAHGAPEGGLDLEVEVTFEPTRVGDDFRASLVVESPVGGKYLVPVSGRATPPKPAGPVAIAPSGGKVQFRNVFTSETTFNISVDNPAFGAPKSERIGPKKTTEFPISYKPTEGRPAVGKLTVTDEAGTAVWVIYLSAAQ